MINKAIAIIPARGGSKGLPRKNILNLSGKPLISWTIDAALKSDFIERVVVSSDDNEILEISKDIGAEALERPSLLASDIALATDVISHVIVQLNLIQSDIKYLVLLQPTSPLRTRYHLDGAFNCLMESGGTSLISVVPLTGAHPMKAFYVRDGYLNGVVNNDYPFMNRQSLPEAFHANGAIYIVELSEYLKKQTLLTDKCIPYEMDAESSLDIDSLEDLKKAEIILQVS